MVAVAGGWLLLLDPDNRVSSSAGLLVILAALLFVAGLVASFALSLENPAQVLGYYVESWTFGLPADYWDTYPARINAVTAAQAQAMLKQLDPATRPTLEQRSGAGEDLPTLSVGQGINIAHALTALGFTPSNKEAKRKIAEGAVRLDDVVVNDPALMLVGAEEPMKLSLGRKKHGLLVR